MRVREAGTDSSLGFDHREVQAILPHRYPFLLIDRVTEFSGGDRLVAIKNVTINEPFFAGHFPGEPLMPGVLICEALAQAGAILAYRLRDDRAPTRPMVLVGLDRVRFRRPVVPGDQLELEVRLLVRRPPLWKMSGRATVAGQLAASAELMAMERTVEPLA